MSWADYDTEALLYTRDRLLVGLARVRDHTAAGTVHALPASGHSSPADAGYLTLLLLNGCEAELRRRETPCPD